MSSILKISLFRGTTLLEERGGGGGGGGGGGMLTSEEWGQAYSKGQSLIIFPSSWRGEGF